MWRSLLPELLMPLPLAALALAVGLWRRRRGMLMVSLGLLLVASWPPTAWLLTRSAEHWSAPTAPADIPMSTAIVVLSFGMVQTPGPTGRVEWSEPDRFFGGIDLWHLGKAPRLIFTGGPVRGSETLTEGDVLRSMALRLGVPDSAVTVTPRVATTRDEAESVARLLAPVDGASVRVIVVTSASHMPRAAAAFERAGLSVVPYAVDFRAARAPALSPVLLVPSAGALVQTQVALRELYGRLFYALTGG